MKANASTILIAGFGIIVAAALTGWMIAGSGDAGTRSAPDGSNVAIVNGTQIVTIRAKGGYAPALSSLKAGVPTTIRFETNGTFDCSAIVNIPSLGISKDLPPKGTTDVPLGVLKPGTIRGTCGMGMYAFNLDVRG